MNENRLFVHRSSTIYVFMGNTLSGALFKTTLCSHSLRYGALMWALGKCVATPEVMRVYIGSFWDQPLREGTNHPLFTAEMEDLFESLHALPKVIRSIFFVVFSGVLRNAFSSQFRCVYSLSVSSRPLSFFLSRPHIYVQRI